MEDVVTKFGDCDDCNGSDEIRKLFRGLDEPGAIIRNVKQFQEENGIDIRSTSMQPALNLLDLLGIPRSNFYKQAATNLAQELRKRIRYVAEHKKKSPQHLEQLEKLLEKIFPLYRVPHLRPVVLDTLAQMPDVPAKYLDIIAKDDDLYNTCAITVRQQIWIARQELFFSSIKAPIDIYITKKLNYVRDIEFSKKSIFTIETTRARRQWSEISTLLELVGEYKQLYSALLQFIRDEYVRTRVPFYCSLRAELIMAAHESNLFVITKNDPCHAMAWCLDACVRDQQLDAVQLGKIKPILDMVPSDQIEVICDMGMIAADPYVTHLLARTIIRRLREHSGEQHLPREMPTVQLAIRLLSLGSHVLSILTTGKIPEEMVDSILMTKFLPIISSIMLEDALRHEVLKTSTELLPDFNANEYTAIPDLVRSFIKADNVAAILYFHYLLDLLPRPSGQFDPKAAIRSFELISTLREKLAIRHVWGHVLIHRLILAYETAKSPILSIPQLWQFIIEDTICTNLETDESAAYLLLRLTNVLSDKWDPSFCLNFVQRIATHKPLDDSNFEAAINRITAKLNARLTRTAPAPQFNQAAATQQPAAS